MTGKKSAHQKKEKQLPSQNEVPDDGWERSTIPDGGWGWVVTFACCISIAICSLFMNTFGLFYTQMIEEFGIDLTSLTVIGSVHSAVSMIGAVVVVLIVEKYGERPVLILAGFLQFLGCFVSGLMTSFPHLLAFMGVVLGIAAALAYVTSLMAVDKYFDKRKSLAVPLASIGASLSMTIFTPVVEFLLEHYQFSGTMLILSAVSLNTVVCGAVVFPLSQHESKSTTQTQDTGDMSFCKRPGFIIYLLSNALYVAGYYIPVGLIPETASAAGVSMDDISLTFSLSGLTQVLGRLAFGVISHRLPSYIMKQWIIYLVGIGLMFLMIPFSTRMYHYLIFNIIGGFFMGGTNLGYNLALKNILETKYYGRGLSLALLMQGLGSFVGNPTAALLQNITGNGGVPYYFGSSVLVLSGLILIPFSKPIQEKSIEIKVAVSENGFRTYATTTTKETESITYIHEEQLYEYSVM